jgi:hypothetical protein
MPYDNMEKELDELLNLNSNSGLQDELSTALIKVDEKELASSNNHIDDDYNYIRANLRSIIGNSNMILETLIPLAQSSENARLYEVLAQHIKTLVESNRELMTVQKDLKSLKEEKSDGNFNKSLGQNIQVDKAVFYGTSSAALEKVAPSKEEK